MRDRTVWRPAPGGGRTLWRWNGSRWVAVVSMAPGAGGGAGGAGAGAGGGAGAGSGGAAVPVVADGPADDILQQSFAAAVGKRITDPFLQADLRRMVDLWFSTTGGNAYNGFHSAEEMWAALDPAAAPYYGMPIGDVPLRTIYNASPAANNVGTWADDIVTRAMAALGDLAAHGAVLVAILAVLLLGLWYLFRGTR